MICKLILSLALQYNSMLFAPAVQHVSVIPISNYVPRKSVPKTILVRWNRVFRPIVIFKKKLSFWLLLMAGITLSAGLVIYLFTIWDADLDGLGYFTLRFFAVLFLSAIVLIGILFLACPILLFLRIIQDMRWSKRFSRCTKF